MATGSISRGLLIKSPHIERILGGQKDWEMRSTRIQIRERIGLIRSQSGLVVGTAEIIDCIGPLDTSSMLASAHRHRLDAPGIRDGLYDKWCYAWVLSGVRALERPVAYQHPVGAVKFVTFEASVREQLMALR